MMNDSPSRTNSFHTNKRNKAKTIERGCDQQGKGLKKLNSLQLYVYRLYFGQLIASILSLYFDVYNPNTDICCVAISIQISALFKINSSNNDDEDDDDDCSC
jgi:hypothetical protein